MNLKDTIKDSFKQNFSSEPLIIRSPGRVNMIGEHTDYNEGFVLPAAIDKESIVAISKRSDSKCRLFSSDFNESYEFDLNKLEKSPNGWANYIIGVVEQFQKSGYPIQGFDCAFGGNIPMGAGLSSSAALECAMAFSINKLFDTGLDKIDMVKLAQKSENEFVGVKCGIMDQFISMFGKKDSVLRLDCRSLEYEYFPFNFSDIKIVLFDTQVKHSLASSAYNTRREQCEAGVKILQKYNPEIKSLRDVPLELLEEHKNEFDDEIYKRCSYVIKENMRLISACEALANNDLVTFGQRMNESHLGLKNDYEVSCDELDLLVDLVKDEDSVLGARMMGGGFGGCTINLVKEEEIERLSEKITKEYKSKTGLDLKVYTGKIQDGTSIIEE